MQQISTSLLRFGASVIAQNPAIAEYFKGNYKIVINLGVSAHVRENFTRLYKDSQIIQLWKTLLSKITIRNFCACTQKSSTPLLRICVYAQIIQRWKTLLSKITIRNFYACMQKVSKSTKDSRQYINTSLLSEII